MGFNRLSDDRINKWTAVNSHPGPLTVKNLTLLYWGSYYFRIRFKLWETLLGYLRSLPRSLFLQSVLKVGWKSLGCGTLCIDFWSSGKGRRALIWRTILSIKSLDTLYIFSCFSVCANGAFSQSSNKQFCINNGNYQRQDTTYSYLKATVSAVRDMSLYKEKMVSQSPTG